MVHKLRAKGYMLLKATGKEKASKYLKSKSPHAQGGRLHLCVYVPWTFCRALWGFSRRIWQRVREGSVAGGNGGEGWGITQRNQVTGSQQEAVVLSVLLPETQGPSCCWPLPWRLRTARALWGWTRGTAFRGSISFGFGGQGMWVLATAGCGFWLYHALAIGQDV